ncbi:unnamed protein product, partial [Mesorhabditis spiculigera]
MFPFLSIFLFSATIKAEPKYGPEIVAETSIGRILGEIVQAASYTAEVYESVPYAEEPSGELRFETPVPRQNWSTILDVRAQTKCPTHVDSTPVAEDFKAIEDCLRLKIVVPLDENGKRFKEKVPLLVWIHGGSYHFGGKYHYNSTGVVKHFASRKIAFASIDYRLGFEGFLSAGDPEIPGNLALEDIYSGLQFLRENANNFGFDVNNIVVAGESAGAALAGITAISPRFKGLLHGAMLFSGTPGAAWGIRNKHTIANTKFMFAKCNCSATADTKSVKECMKKAPIDCYRTGDKNELDRLGKKNGRTYENQRMGETLFTPIVDASRGEDAMLPDKLENLISQHAHLPILISNAAHEQMAMMRALVTYLNHYGTSIPQWFGEMVPDRYNASATVKLLLKERYLPEKFSDQVTIRKLSHWSNDEWTTSAHETALQYADKNLTVYTLLNDVFDEPEAEVYESIPYAEEPSGDLRFEKPVPRLNWSTILDVRENTACPTYARDYQLIYVEDCLRLKVVVPLDEHGKVGGKKYYASSGVIKNIASRKIAFASIDYRLAFEGFLSNGDKDFPGNLALEDLLLGINFLRENADNFGFDANNIVVAGESAGGSLAGLMAISPRFKGLFHGVMMFSGSPSSAWAIRTKHTAANSRQLFERCNCTTTPGSQAIKECMKKAPVQCYRDIDEFEFDVKGKNNGGIYEGWRMATSWFTPVVDAHRGAESFLQEKPETLSKKHAHLPAIIQQRRTRADYIPPTSCIRFASDQLEEGWMTVDDFFDAQVPERYNASAVVRMLIKERYQPKRTRERITVVRKLTQFTTDEWLADAQYEALDYAAKNLTVYSLINDVFDAPDGGEELFDSTTHGTDLFMLFENQGITERINFLPSSRHHGGVHPDEETKRSPGVQPGNSAIDQNLTSTVSGIMSTTTRNPIIFGRCFCPPSLVSISRERTSRLRRPGEALLEKLFQLILQGQLVVFNQGRAPQEYEQQVEVDDLLDVKFFGGLWLFRLDSGGRSIPD